MAQNVSRLDNNTTDIRIVRGDTFIFPFIIRTQQELKYVPNPSDTITLYVYNKYTDAKPLLQKKIPYDDLFIRFSAKETESMRFGNYVYVIKVKYGNNYVDTILNGNFSIVVPGGD